jgi:pimeloyl-ACP methyl ester carboxylesterase
MPQPTRWPAVEHSGWLEAKQSVDLVYLATDSGRPGTPWPELVRSVADPTLVVTGTNDCLVGGATRAELDAIANAAIEVVVVADAGHYVRQDRPDAFHAVVDPWLAEHIHPYAASTSANGTVSTPDGMRRW